MKISRRAEYAVRAVLDLALHAPRSGGSRSLEIARRSGLPEKFLDAVLLDLRKAGIIASKRGPDGGHWLARDPSRLTVATILEAMDGSASIVARPEARAGSAADVCLAGLWTSVTEAVRGVADKITIDDLRRQVEQHGVSDYSI